MIEQVQVFRCLEGELVEEVEPRHAHRGDLVMLTRKPSVFDDAVESVFGVITQHVWPWTDVRKFATTNAS